MLAGYNNVVQATWPLGAILFTAAMLGQFAPPPPCPAERPVDDIIKQSKKKHRNSDPLPQVICTPECIERPITTPPTFPEAPQMEVSTKKSTSLTDAPETNSGDTCGEATKMAIEAAHDVEVGDSYFGQQNYRGALQRYSKAVEEKPGDLAIHVRLAQTFEKLRQIPEAIQEYKAAQKLAGPQKWLEQAKSSLMRLQHASGS
jgi:Tetratricopeptide repeat